MDSTSINFSEFKNKKILITGGSTGIGAELAKAFAKQGAIVGLHYFSSADEANQVASEILSEGGSVELIRADASDSKALAAAVNEAAERLGGLNGLINNAGGMVRRVPYANVTDKDYDEIMDLNARSIVVASKEALPFLKQQGGFVINTTSIAARNGAGGGAGAAAAERARGRAVRGAAGGTGPVDAAVQRGGGHGAPHSRRS